MNAFEIVQNCNGFGVLNGNIVKMLGVHNQVVRFLIMAYLDDETKTCIPCDHSQGTDGYIFLGDVGDLDFDTIQMGPRSVLFNGELYKVRNVEPSPTLQEIFDLEIQEDSYYVPGIRSIVEPIKWTFSNLQPCLQAKLLGSVNDSCEYIRNFSPPDIVYLPMSTHVLLAECVYETSGNDPSEPLITAIVTNPLDDDFQIIFGTPIDKIPPGV